MQEQEAVNALQMGSMAAAQDWQQRLLDTETRRYGIERGYDTASADIVAKRQAARQAREAQQTAAMIGAAGSAVGGLGSAYGSSSYADGGKDADGNVSDIRAKTSIGPPSARDEASFMDTLDSPSAYDHDRARIRERLLNEAESRGIGRIY
jgi:hypothetical protein